MHSGIRRTCHFPTLQRSGFRRWMREEVFQTTRDQLQLDTLLPLAHSLQRLRIRRRIQDNLIGSRFDYRSYSIMGIGHLRRQHIDDFPVPPLIPDANGFKTPVSIHLQHVDRTMQLVCRYSVFWAHRPPIFGISAHPCTLPFATISTMAYAIMYSVVLSTREPSSPNSDVWESSSQAYSAISSVKYASTASVRWDYIRDVHSNRRTLESKSYVFSMLLRRFSSPTMQNPSM